METTRKHHGDTTKASWTHHGSWCPQCAPSCPPCVPMVPPWYHQGDTTEAPYGDIMDSPWKLVPR